LDERQVKDFMIMVDSARGKIAPFSEIEQRISLLQGAMQEKEVDGVLILQKTDLFYFAATSQQGYLYIPAEGKPLLLVFRDFARAESESSLADIVPLTSVKKIPQLLSDYGYVSPGVLGMELDVLPANLYFFYSKLFGQGKITDISPEIRLIRAVKSEFEVEKLRQAALLSDKVAAKVPELLVPGKTEIEVAGELEAYARSLGHQGIVRMRLWGSELFYGHLMSGGAAAVPSYLASPTGGEGVSSFVAQGPGFKKISRNEPVLVDYVFALDGYISDHARIFSLGSLSSDLLDAHQAMLEVQNETKMLAKPGVVTGELYEMMVSMASERGYGDNFMGVGEKRIRFTGHGVGLELDEFPFIAKGQKLELQAGMIIALEPKTIFPGIGVVGIENTHLVTKQGLEPLTKISDEITFVS